MKILHIDDNKLFTDTLSKLLTFHNHDCESCNDGKVALQLTLTKKYDVIILDLEMPEYSGRDFINELERLNQLSTQKIIILTGFLPADDERNNLLQRGIIACLEKPVPIKKLNDLLTKLQENDLII